MLSNELQHLLKKYINNSISENEFHELWETLRHEQYEGEWHSAMDAILAEKKNQSFSDDSIRERKLQEIIAIIESRGDSTLQQENSETPVTTIPARQSMRIIARKMLPYAAIFVFFLLIAAVFKYKNKQVPHENIQLSFRNTTKEHSIKPGSQKALLTLADGTTITLDSAANGIIAKQGGTQVLKLANGMICYVKDKANNQPENISYNKMSTPRGGQYQLTLPDGSVIWLNAESSITYPTAFSGNERKVSITGEVYFEVVKDKSKPFKVTAGDQQIKVLGTHFNINAYEDEDHVKTSLLEGSVNVNQQILKPGEAFQNGKVSKTNVDQDVAWKNGIFNFNNQSLAQVMRQLARWYNLEVIYPGGVPRKEYGGEMGRNLTLNQVLKGLENSGIYFELEGRKLLVKSKN